VGLTKGTYRSVINDLDSSTTCSIDLINTGVLLHINAYMSLQSFQRSRLILPAARAFEYLNHLLDRVLQHIRRSHVDLW
jgi:hypothetical protein